MPSRNGSSAPGLLAKINDLRVSQARQGTAFAFFKIPDILHTHAIGRRKLGVKVGRTQVRLNAGSVIAQNSGTAYVFVAPGRPSETLIEFMASVPVGDPVVVTILHTLVTGVVSRIRLAGTAWPGHREVAVLALPACGCMAIGVTRRSMGMRADNAGGRATVGPRAPSQW